jgi:hypothetical protein
LLTTRNALMLILLAATLQSNTTCFTSVFINSSKHRSLRTQPWDNSYLRLKSLRQLSVATKALKTHMTKMNTVQSTTTSNLYCNCCSKPLPKNGQTSHSYCSKASPTQRSSLRKTTNLQWGQWTSCLQLKSTSVKSQLSLVCNLLPSQPISLRKNGRCSRSR